MNCPLCNLSPVPSPSIISLAIQVTCPNCGVYELTLDAQDEIGLDAELAFKLASWVNEQNVHRLQPRVDQERVVWMRKHPKPSTERRGALYLAAVIRSMQGTLIGTFDHFAPALQVASWSFNRKDCVALARYLLDLKALGESGNNSFQLIAKGHIIHEKWSEERIESSQVFVGMWFHKKMNKPYDHGVSKAISGAGYTPLRVDREEHDGKIDDLIIAEIRRSAFVVADFTGHRAGVYYEAGFAHGLGRRVIFTCHDKALEGLHFDVRQYNTISWTKPADIIAPLQNRILAIFGAGPGNRDAQPIRA